MLHFRVLVYWSVLSVLASACAAENAAGPGVELPDADAPAPPSPAPDAARSSTPPPAVLDAQAQMPPPPGDAAAAGQADGGPVPRDNADYTCTHLIGINATAEWYNVGFESLVDNGKWQLVRVHSGFVQLWADPNAGAWSTAPSSPCTQNSKNPDRVLFVALNFDYDKLEQWLPPLQAVVKNLQAKFPGVRRIELGSFVRAPGNRPCPQRAPARSTITEAQDAAIAMVAAANPELVRAMPRFEAKTCSEFSGNPPHPSKAGGEAWAKMIAEHYGPGK